MVSWNEGFSHGDQHDIDDWTKPGSSSAQKDGTKEERNQETTKNEPPTVPTSIASWIAGALNEQQNLWFMQYIESDVFKSTQHRLKLRTGIDLNWLVAACVAMKSGKDQLPKLMEDVLGQVKAQTTSSITIGTSDSTLQDQLLRYIRNGLSKTSTSWLNLHGRHDMRDKEGELDPLPGEMRLAFWHGSKLFLVDEAKGKHLQNEASKSEELKVIKVMPGSKFDETRDKRSLNSIDLEPRMKKYISQVIEDFFHPESRALYRATSRPYRHGFLLYGPPGTDKTSLSVAIASHVGLPLVTITLRGMDDMDLENAFTDLPLPCVVLVEDVDASSADVGNRQHLPKTKQLVTQEKAEMINADEAASAINQAVGHLRSELESDMKTIVQKQDEIHTMLKEYMADQDYSYDNTDETNFANECGQPRQKNAAVLPPKQAPPPPPAKSVTLSGLLNIGFATKNTAEQTFKRIFASDPRKIHQTNTINRFARAFKDHFPETSEISTASLAKYCALHRNRPIDAVESFPRWLEVGDEIFSYNIEAQRNDIDPSTINIAQPFDRTLLKVNAADFVTPTIEEKPAEDEPEVKSSFFNSLRWVLGNKSASQQSVQSPPERLMLTTQDHESGYELDPEMAKMALSLVSFDLSLGSFAYAEAQPQMSQPPQFHGFVSDLDEFDDEVIDSMPCFTLADRIKSIVPPPTESRSAMSEDEHASDEGSDEMIEDVSADADETVLADNDGELFDSAHEVAQS
ncbi:hypothetical protein EK21DRAFT_87462 [Setomelanomma holmii]|uniref:ATPase AAA-type core domain-containing protein n=1 Tax=Setomelanomma holmii TaxID=210430 RepID=A0A9P4HDK5_9PLEO|nr:hypothetical protein EK21DRAFT_87462 [Setomelanomma holmii]